LKNLLDKQTCDEGKRGKAARQSIFFFKPFFSPWHSLSLILFLESYET
jgi:hypothetical protein